MPSASAAASTDNPAKQRTLANSAAAGSKLIEAEIAVSVSVPAPTESVAAVPVHVVSTSPASHFCCFLIHASPSRDQGWQTGR